MTDPVHEGEDGKWYFWNEVWADEVGPYASEEEARDWCRAYARQLYREPSL